MIENKAIEIIKHEYIDNHRFFVREVYPRLWLRLNDDDSFSFPVNMADDLPDGYWDNSDDNDSVTDEYWDNGSDVPDEYWDNDSDDDLTLEGLHSFLSRNLRRRFPNRVLKVTSVITVE